MSQRKTRSGALVALTLSVIAIGFVATVMLSNNALRSSRIDLTDDGLFTLSQGTRNVLSNLDEPVTLRFYFSSRLSREIPRLGIINFQAYFTGTFSRKLLEHILDTLAIDPKLWNFS
jgi:ABC-type uncharacterized transport system involved in gliding motility auxiliary subunit